MRIATYTLATAMALAAASPAAAGGLFGGGINVSPKVGVYTGHVLSGNKVGVLNGNAVLNGTSVLNGSANGNVLGILSGGRKDKKRCKRRC